MFKYLKTLKNVSCDTTAPAFLSRFFPEHHVLVYRCIAFKAVASMSKQCEGTIDRRIPSKSEASPSINCTRSRTPMLTPTVAPPLRFRKGKSRSKKRVDFHGSFVYLLLLSLQFSFFCRFLQYPVQYSDIVVRVFRWKISLVSVMFLFFRVVPPTFATGEIVKCEFLFQRERVNF